MRTIPQAHDYGITDNGRRIHYPDCAECGRVSESHAAAEMRAAVARSDATIARSQDALARSAATIAERAERIAGANRG